jgi:hypothetical protein
MARRFQSAADARGAARETLGDRIQRARADLKRLAPCAERAEAARLLGSAERAWIRGGRELGERTFRQALDAMAAARARAHAEARTPAELALREAAGRSPGALLGALLVLAELGR